MRSLLLTLSLAATALAATYKGDSLDGKTLKAQAQFADQIFPAKVNFNGSIAMLQIADGRSGECRLNTEVIDDPKHIECTAAKGLWIISLEDI